MRSLFLLLGSLVFVGCAHQAEERIVFVERSSESFEVTPPSAPAPVVAQDAAASRPRLGHVVTLGQNSEDAAYSSPDAPPPPPQAPGPNVVINNYGGGGYGYGYGGYYGGYGYGYPGTYASGARGARSQSRGAQNAWAPTGWEGAGRTAAPGQTPGVAGNWPTPPSYGAHAPK